MIDVYKARFYIKKVNNVWCFIVKYGEKHFIALSGNLEYIKDNFTKVVNNRELLIPVIQRALSA